VGRIVEQVIEIVGQIVEPKVLTDELGHPADELDVTGAYSDTQPCQRLYVVVT
jgi:hypothetical protein